MKKIILGLCLGIIVSCASDVVIPILKNRRLRPCLNGLCYQYCEKYGFWRPSKCKDGRFKTVHYDLTKPETVSKLKANGFSCTSERRWK